MGNHHSGGVMSPQEIEIMFHFYAHAEDCFFLCDCSGGRFDSDLKNSFIQGLATLGLLNTKNDLFTKRSMLTFKNFYNKIYLLDVHKEVAACWIYLKNLSLQEWELLL